MTVLIKVSTEKLSDADISYINNKMESLTDKKAHYLTVEEFDNHIGWFVKRSKKINVGCVEHKVSGDNDILKTMFETSEMFSEKFDSMMRYLYEHSEDGVLNE
ncbi:TPA: hypothetical protein ACGWER_001762 [Streptococcus agalactiae]|nr:hypothetical protein [Streptococcus agalactiae]HEO2267410.1 hypothetical protein [Streptococcus agalactiae]HEO7770336.1 hypothetical protein [Streptococcus agalactiae]